MSGVRAELGALVSLYMDVCLATPSPQVRDGRFATIPNLKRGLVAVGRVRHANQGVYECFHCVRPE